MDLENKTEMDLLDMRQEINSAINSYADRGKTKVFTVFEEFEGTKYFTEKPKAWEHILWLHEIDSIFEPKIVMDTKYLTDAEIKNWCDGN